MEGHALERASGQGRLSESAIRKVRDRNSEREKRPRPGPRVDNSWRWK